MDVAGGREEDADDVVVVDVVAIEELLHHLDHALTDVVRLVAIDGGRAT